MAKTESVSELTEKLKTYDAQFMTEDAPVKKIKILGQEISLLDCAKIVIADVKGAISGYSKGGTSQAIIEAGVASICKFVEILDKKRAKAEQVKPGDALLKTNGTYNYNDSIGYYHIYMEKDLYSTYGARIKDMQPLAMIRHSHVEMRHASTGYLTTNKYDVREMRNSATRIEKLRSIEDTSDTPYADYYEKVRALDTEDGEYLDFASEYAYTCLYGNVGNVRDYTLSVLKQIDNSNAVDRDKNILAQSIYIAYSSLVFSSGVEVVDQ